MTAQLLRRPFGIALGAALLSALSSAAPARADTINLNVTIRDFCGIGFDPNCPNGFASNPDFENAVVDDRGIVKTALGGDGTPQFAGGSHPSLFGTDSSTPLGTKTTAEYFNQFYHDTAGFNQTTTIALPFVNNGAGIYQFSNSAFFPIDNQLLGNEGQGHNFSFTAQLHTKFTFQTGQNFSFTGDDDVWVFINDSLVIDLGGVHGAESASVDLNTLGLTPGTDYDFDLFFAERHTTQSDLAIDTSIVFENNTAVPEPMSIALFGGGLAALGLLRRRRRV